MELGPVDYKSIQLCYNLFESSEEQKFSSDIGIWWVDLVVYGQVLWCTFTASGLWVTKVLMVKILANTFHRSAYFDRIQDSLFHQYVLETISKPMKKSSIAAAKKIKPPVKTPEIPKVIQMCCTGPKYVECSPKT
jgi:hypothetical protein